MAETDQQPDDRTEAATPRRLQRAREEGRVPVSREIQTLAGLIAVTLALLAFGGSTAQHLAVHLAAFLSRADSPALAAAPALRLAAIAMLQGAQPFVLAALLAGVAAVSLQTGFLIHGGALQPDLSRLSPRAGLRRLFGADSLVEAGKSVAKVATMGLAIWSVLRGDLPALMLAPRWDAQTLLARTMPMVLHVLYAAIAVQTVIAAADLFWVRLRHVRMLRMSKQELREEQRDLEGDPRFKARLKQIRMQRARKRMLAAVPKATVVVTNPTHYAVALAYDRTKAAAPRVVAKGVDTLAARIREVATANKVPLVANPPLAQALFRVEVDTEIPAQHYQAVAEIIAYVWRLGRQAPRPGVAA